jgi:hypothetical protein
MLAPAEMRIIGELMALARAGKIEPTPRKSRWPTPRKGTDELRAGKVVGRIALKN